METHDTGTKVGEVEVSALQQWLADGRVKHVIRCHCPELVDSCRIWSEMIKHGQFDENFTKALLLALFRNRRVRKVFERTWQ